MIDSLPILHFITFICFLLPISPASPHSISFPTYGLHPSTELTWDPFSHHFLAGSFPNPPSILCITEAGVAHLLLTDPSLPPNSTFFGLSVDPVRRRLLAVLRSTPHSSQCLASYDLRTYRRLFLAQLPSSAASGGGAASVAVDGSGTAYVTDAVENIIWKITVQGYATVFSRSPLFSEFPIRTDGLSPKVGYGLNGIAYVSKGYLLVVQSTTGKMFKVKEDGSARVVELTEDVAAAEGVAVRRDGVVVVMGDCRRKVWYLRSYDSWATGVVYDVKGIDEKRGPMAVVAGGGDRIYVLYHNSGGGEEEQGVEGKRVWYNMEEIVSSEDGAEDEHFWIFILLGLGLAYFWFWRFQMGRLFVSLNRKIQ